MQPRHIIDALGKPRTLAENLGGIPASTVAYWKHRNSIPAKWWGPLVRIARERQIDSVTLESLAAAHAPTQAA